MFSSDIQIQVSIRFSPQSDYGYGREPTLRVRSNSSRRDMVQTAMEEAMDILNQVNMAEVQYGFHLGDLETKGMASSSPLIPMSAMQSPSVASPAPRPEDVLLMEMEKGGGIVNTSI